MIGYHVYMDTGGDGNFQLVLDGKHFPGVNYYEATGLQAGSRYRFKVAALNFNGEGASSDEAEFFSCLPPTDLLPPTYISSTETTLTLDWTHPLRLNGCPLQTFELFMDDGQGGDLTTLVASFQPQVSQTQITSFTGSDTSKTFRFQVRAITAAGSVLSGVSSFKLAAVPQQPGPPLNVAAETDDTQISVSFGETVPDNGGAEVITI